MLCRTVGQFANRHHLIAEGLGDDGGEELTPGLDIGTVHHSARNCYKSVAWRLARASSIVGSRESTEASEVSEST